MATHAKFETLEALRSEIVDYVRERLAESLACAECDIDSPPSLAVALHQGWTRLQVDDAAGHNFLGLCPDCKRAQAEEVAAEVKPPDKLTKPAAPAKVPRTPGKQF